MGTPLDSLFSEPLSTAMTAYTGIENYAANLRAQEANQRLFDAGQQLLADRSRLAFNRNEGFNHAQQYIAARMARTTQRQFAERQRRGLGMLSRIGDQDRSDLRQAFGNAASRTNAQLAGAGLSGTAIGAGVNAGYANASTAAQNRLSDSIAQRRFGAFAGLSGDRLNARQQSNANLLNLRESGQSRLMQDFLRTSGDRANFLNSISVVGPNQSTAQALNTALGRGSASTPEAPGVGQQALAGGAVSAATTAGTAVVKLIIKTCLDENATVRTRRGDVAMKDVEHGDLVLGADDAYHAVVAKDHGWVPPAERAAHVELKTGRRSLIVTADHPVGGRPAGEWKTGDAMSVLDESREWHDETIESAHPVDYVIGGDIALEGNVDYVANGFRVTSVLGSILDGSAQGALAQVGV